MDAYRTMPRNDAEPPPKRSRLKLCVGLALLAAYAVVVVWASVAAFGTDGLAIVAGCLAYFFTIVALRLRATFDPRFAERYRARVELRAERWMRDGGRAPRPWTTPC